MHRGFSRVGAACSRFYWQAAALLAACGAHVNAHLDNPFLWRPAQHGKMALLLTELVHMQDKIHQPRMRGKQSAPAMA